MVGAFFCLGMAGMGRGRFMVGPCLEQGTDAEPVIVVA